MIEFIINPTMQDREPRTGDLELEGAKVFLRAVRSLAWNRQLLPIIQERLNRAESIVRSQLLIRGGESIAAGPFGVSLNEDQEIDLSWQGGDDWQQLHLPDFDSLIDDPLDANDEELP